ncbi:hypothetical protein KJB58_07310 [Staphylococcus hyicus]|uniref:hypothetical protein n=1 Tax=Staphylococcus hyicus TaxID=1284 RepID=UPI001F172506|nr:hypothetical protein [Staphylococcus hyicus]MCE5154272.1 hypothetical protein [Staphylococcus hyicus]
MTKSFTFVPVAVALEMRVGCVEVLMECNVGVVSAVVVTVFASLLSKDSFNNAYKEVLSVFVLDTVAGLASCAVTVFVGLD